jgi:hypothetical protein
MGTYKYRLYADGSVIFEDDYEAWIDADRWSEKLRVEQQKLQQRENELSEILETAGAKYIGETI